MARRRYAAALFLLALTACGGGNEEAPLDAGNVATEAGKAEEGRLSIKGPGIDLAISVPEALRGRARVDGDNNIMPPGAAIAGMHVQGNGGDAQAGQDSVELRFTSEQSVEDVAAWYRDPARSADFRVTAARREGAETVIAGTTGGQDAGGTFTARLTARAGGGTNGRLILVDGG
jgi:hypothetical protein